MTKFPLALNGGMLRAKRRVGSISCHVVSKDSFLLDEN